jgi:uncharacterized membrane protein
MLDALMPWVKLVHVATIALWSAGLVALPMLFGQRGGLSDTPLHRLHAFTRFFYVALVSPAAFIAIASGTALIFLQASYATWFSLKLAMVAALTGFHIFSGLMILKLFEPGRSYPAWRMAVVVPATLIVIGAILALVLGKPDIAVSEATMAFFAPGALSKTVSGIIGWSK